MKLKFSLAIIFSVMSITTAKAVDVRLEPILNTEVIRCGSDLSVKSFAYQEDGEWKGFDADLCRAFAWAIYGDGSKFEMVDVRPYNVGRYLKGGLIDVMLSGGVFSAGSFQENIADNLSSLAQHNSKGFTNALSSLAPTAVPLVALMNTQGMETVANLVGRRTEKQPDLNTGLSSGEDSKKADIQIWAEGIYSQSRLNGQTLLKTHTRGATVGTDIRFGSFITGAGYLHSGTRAKTTLRKTHIKTQGIFFYSSYQPNNFFADFILGGQQGDYKEEKIYALKADYKAKTIWGREKCMKTLRCSITKG